MRACSCCGLYQHHPDCPEGPVVWEPAQHAPSIAIDAAMPQELDPRPIQVRAWDLVAAADLLTSDRGNHRG